MQNLIQLFLKLSGLITFVIFEIICFSLIVKFNQSQKDIYANSTNLLSAYLLEKNNNVREYLHLKTVNKELAESNASLLSKLAELGIDTSSQEFTRSVDSTISYSVFESHVLRNSVHQNHNYLLINKGRKDGVVPNCGVVATQGVVGIVRKVSGSNAVVMSVLHRQNKISARVRGKYQFGSLVWKGNDIRQFNLEDVPKFAPLAKGDTIETSGYSSIFPPGIMLGTIKHLWVEPGSNFFTIEVQYVTDLSNIQHVLVIRNHQKEEQDSLMVSVIKEDE